MARGQITTADILAVSDGIGVAQLLAKLGYDVSDPADQTASGLGVAERTQHLVRTVRRLVGQRAAPRLPPALEIYWFETSVLTADLRQSLVAAFRNKPAQVLLLVTTRDFGQLDFVLVQKSLAVVAAGGQVSLSHQLFSVDRRQPLLQWGLTQSSEEVRRQAACSALSSGFNGASPNRVRKCDKMMRKEPAVSTLQWGLTQSSEEVSIIIGHVKTKELLQWGLTQSSEEV